MRLVEATEAHIPALAARMREADRLEAGAFGREPASAITYSLRSSLWALSALVDDEPHAMLGVSPLNMMAGQGVPWMLGSERVYDHARDLVRYGPGIIGEMEAAFPSLENYVSAGNKRAIAFLRHWGWRFSEAIETIGGVGFRRFSNV